MTRVDSDPTMSTPGQRQGGWLTHRLILVASPDSSAVGRALFIGDAPVVLGRASRTAGNGPLRLVDPELSREHAVFERDPATGAIWVTDKGSRNGTYVNAGRQTKTGLVDQDVLRLGGTLIVYERAELEADAPLVAAQEPPLLGPSLPMQRVRGEVARVATRNLPVLVLGETGTGKELVARALHERSGRTGAFVAVNCGALPADLVESELFGHVSGAFTGATRANEGLFVRAHGGTIFLDEIGEMPAAVQPKLLRALATGEIRAVGASHPQIVDARVVAATHRNLEGDVKAETFRGDLFARLAGWKIELAPLRRRKEDILGYARVFLTRAGASTAINPDAAEALLVHRWPFNVRELEQACASIAVRAAGQPTIELVHLPPELRGAIEIRRPLTTASEPPLALSVRPDGTPTAEDLLRVVRHYGGNVAQVAAYFGRDRRQIYRWLERYEIDPDKAR